MQLEEILIRLGVDQTALSKGLTSASASIKQWAHSTRESINESFKESFKTLFAPLTGLATFEGLNKLFEFGEKIHKVAEELGVSTDFIQGFQQAARELGTDSEKATTGLQKLAQAIGEARSGSKDAGEKFSKWGIELVNADGTAKDVEEVVGDLADRMHESGDAAIRNAIAFETMGKSGKELVNVLSQGRKGLDEMIGAAHKLSEEDIQALATSKRNIEQVSNSVTTFAGKVVGLIASGAGSLGAFFTGGGEEARRQANEESGAEVNSRFGKRRPVEDVSALQYKLAELRKKTQDAQSSHEEKLNSLIARRLELRRTMEGFKEGTTGYLTAQIELEENEKKIAEEKLEVDKKKTEEARKQLEITKQIKEHEATLASDQRKKREALQGLAPFPTDEEIKNSGFWQRGLGGSRFWQRSPFAKLIGEKEGLEADVTWNRIFGFGNSDINKKDLSRISEINQTLERAGVKSPSSHLESIDENIKKQSDDIANLKAMATQGGLKVIPTNGK